MSGLVILAIIAIAGFVLGSGEILDYSSDNNGTVRINRVSAGVNSMEADTFIGDVTGDVTGNIAGAVTATTISASGVVTTSADVDMDATGGTCGDPDFSVDGWAKFNGTLEVGATARTRAAVIFDNLPFTDPGVRGQLWMKSGGTLKVSQ